MTDDRWARVKNTFHAALELPPDARAAFLAKAAGHDAELRSEVEALLAADAGGVESARLPLMGGAGLPAGFPFVTATEEETRRTASVPRDNRLGPYEILGLIGAGGMGEVYRARDTKLGRDVALKVLPAAFADNAERLARFKREAQLLAALNHPHIAAIYGLEESPGRQALVLELVEGDTLADRIRSGPLPANEALRIAAQIAEALAAAHHKSIVHRDLKPANIKVTPDGTVKVLDFGLAKTAASFETSLASEAQTRAGDTSIGTILGTAAYMSPEQARGEPVDARTDVWAFGCVLFEMLTGTKAFGASATTSSAARILERDPDWLALPAATPRAVQALLRRCLEKDPGRRPQTMVEARTVIDTILGRPSVRLRWAVGAAAALVAAVAVYVALRPAPPPLVNRTDWTQITNLDSVTQPSLSPDGRMVAFVRGPSTFVGPGQVYLKPLPDGEPVALTSDAGPKMGPVFSPDGARIAYTVNDGESWDTWEVPVLRGSPRLWLKNASGLVWFGQRDLLFSEIKDGLHMAIVRAAESRAGARDLYVPPHSAGMAHRSYGSPDGEWALVVEMNEASIWIPCRLLRIDDPSSRQVGPVNARCTNAAWSPDQRWMYFTADAGDGFHVWRQRFPDGPPEQLSSGPTEEEGLAVAPDGRSLITSVGLSQRSVWLHDDRGERQISLEGYASWPLLSSDGRKLLYRVTRSSGGSGLTPSEVHVADLATGESRRLFPGQLVAGYDLSADDRVIAAVVQADGAQVLWIGWLDDHEPPRRIPGVISENPRFGRRGDVVFTASEGDRLYVERIGEDGSGRRRLGEAGSNVLGTVSPDGEWISGISSDRGHMVLFSLSGRAPVRVFPYSQTTRLRWSPDGSRLYFAIQYGAASGYATGRTYALPLVSGTALPVIPAGGFRNEAEIAALPNVEMVPYGDVGPGPTSSAYTFSKITTTRNLYRIPLP